MPDAPGALGCAEGPVQPLAVVMPKVPESHVCAAPVQTNDGGDCGLAIFCMRCGTGVGPRLSARQRARRTPMELPTIS